MEIPDGQVKQASAGNIGENQNGKADQFGNGRGRRGARNAHIQSEDKNGVQDHVQNPAEAHADHGQGGASLAAQALVHDKVRSHKGRGKQDIGGILNAVALAGGRCAQKTNHGGYKGGACTHQNGAQKHCQEKGGGKHPAGLVVLSLPQQPGNIAVGTHGQHGARHHDQLVQRGVDADGGGGVGAQGADEVGIRKTVDGVDEKCNNGGNCHPWNNPGYGLVQHHSLPVLPVGGALLLHEQHPFCNGV